MRVAIRDRQQHRDRRTESRNLRQREIDEDDAALHDVDAEIGVDPGENQTRDEGRREKLENGREVHGYFAPVRLIAATSVLTS